MGKILITVFCFFFCLGSTIFAASKTDLQGIKEKASLKEKQLKEYQEKQKKLEQELKNLTQKEKQTGKKTEEIKSNLIEVKSKTSSLQSRREMMKTTLPMWQTLMKETLTATIVENILQSDFNTGETVSRNLILNSLLDVKAGYYKNLQKSLEKNEKDLKQTELEKENLLSQQSALEAEKEKLEATHKDKEKDLTTAKEKLKQAKKELEELKNSAEQMEKLLKQAEKKRAASEKKQGLESKPASTKELVNVAKKSLPWPLNGQVISRFGKEYNQQLKTWIFRDGIKIAAFAGTPIKAVEGGKVIFAGAFRSYGQVVIVDHGQGFFTIYGFLQEIKAYVGEVVKSGSVIGTCGYDTQGTAMGQGKAALYFEVRSGTQALDPLVYLKSN
ncbi:MAG: peptidoglycan DD-metalloendopeptidase family protein [Elusimicrobiaceae bacterium]|nr:peptidoglycan DD-metalloendopeptidase family protein [Elusimicrobiaceae bacterium]